MEHIKSITVYLVINHITTVEISSFSTSELRPVDILPRCYNCANAYELAIRLSYRYYIYEGTENNYAKVSYKNKPMDWLNSFPQRYDYSVFLVDEDVTIKKSLPQLRYLQTIMHRDIIQHLLTYYESPGQYSYLIKAVASIFDLFYRDQIHYMKPKDIKQAKKDLQLCLYYKRQCDYKRMLPLGGGPQKVTVLIPNHYAEGDDYRTSFNVHKYDGISPLSLYWICHSNLLSKGIDVIRLCCTVDGTDLFEIEYIDHCEVVEVKYTPKEPYYLRIQLNELLKLCTKSQNHLGMVPIVDNYINQLAIEYSIMGEPKAPLESLRYL